MGSSAPCSSFQSSVIFCHLLICLHDIMLITRGIYISNALNSDTWLPSMGTNFWSDESDRIFWKSKQVKPFRYYSTKKENKSNIYYLFCYRNFAEKSVLFWVFKKRRSMLFFFMFLLVFRTQIWQIYPFDLKRVHPHRHSIPT